MEEIRDSNLAMDLRQETNHHFVSETLVKQRGRKRKHDETQEFDPDVENKRILANSQERVRMHKINHALEDLRKCLPQQFHLYHRRMSKIRTLRLAMNYINTLSEILREDDMRRQAEYRDTRVCSQATVQRETPSVPMFQMPTTVIPYYPYLAGACPSFSATESMYRTPDQPSTQQIYSPRQLSFNAMSQAASEHPLPESIVAGSICTPVKSSSTKRLFQREGIINTPESVRKTIRTETITSPFLGMRNQVELNSSFLSSTSDSVRDESEEPGQIHTRGLYPYQTNPYHTLVDIIDGDGCIVLD